MSLSYKDISEILKIIDASNCEELVLEVGDTKLVVQRNGGGSPTASVAATAEKAAPQPAKTAEAVPTPAAPAIANSIAAGATGTEIRAPMVGTFYRKPSPADPAFVETGQAVKKGDPLCLIEVMKLYTTIEAPVDGTVVAIGANDTELVSHDQVLFVIEHA
jgi:acetyl-CoA carboxylase biotin carboxyl carrier protein